MRVENWSWREADNMVVKTTRKRLLKAAELIAGKVRQNLKRQIGTGKTTGISRPAYKTGPYAGQAWTARNFGELLHSVRVVERKEDKYGFALAQFTSLGNYGEVRVYAGNYMAYYARIFEYTKPFMRPAVEASKAEVKRILENG